MVGTKYWGIGFAFERFAKCKYPVFADNRKYTKNKKRIYHRHDYVQLWYCYEGEYFHQIEEETIQCRKGSVVMIPAGVCHDMWYEDSASVLCLNIHRNILLDKPISQFKNTVIQAFLGDFFREIDPNYSYYRMLSSKSQEIVEKVFSGFILMKYEQNISTGDVRIWQWLEEIFSLPEFSVPDEEMEKALHIVENRVLPVFKIISYLNEHYGEKIIDETLLKVANVSRAVMYRYFKRILGETYAVYLQKLRVRRAHIYMRDTTFPITQISQICGFYDVCHLTRVYTKYLGTTPSQQRQYLRQMYGGHDKK